MANTIDNTATVRHNPGVVKQIKEYCESEGAYTKNVGKFYDLAALEELRKIEMSKKKNKNKNNE